MKKILIYALTAIAASVSMVCNADILTIGRFKQSRPVSIIRPAFGDSTAQKAFNPAKLLNYTWNGDFTTVAGGTTASDTTGFLHLTKPDKDAQIIGLRSRLRAHRFTKGKLSVTSALPFEAYANGESIGKKETSEDSITSASTQKFTLDLQPEYVTEITIKVVIDASSHATPDVKVEYIPDEKYEDIDIAVDPDMQKRFSIKTTVDGSRVASSALSPDGKYLITFYTHTYKPDNVRSWATLTETASGRILNSDISPQAYWLPGNTNKLVSVVNNNDKYDLYTTEVPSMRRELLAQELPTYSFYIAPDASYIIYNDYVEGDHEVGPMKRITSPDDRIPGNRSRVYLMKHSLKDGYTQPLTSAGTSTQLLDFSPDSKKILYITVRETPEKHPFYAKSIIQLDVNTLQTDTIVKDDTSLSGAIYSPDASQIFAWGGPLALNMLGANQGELPYPNDFDTQGFIIDVKSHKAQAVTRDFDPAVIGAPVWNRADGKIYFRAYDKFYTPIYSYDPKTDKFDRLDVQCDRVSNFSIGENESRWLTYTGQSYDHAGALYRIDLKTGKSIVIQDPLASNLAEVNWGKYENIPFTASDGTQIDANLILPPDFDPTKKYPMIVYYYGGTLPSDRSMASPYSTQLFASRDYIVYVINPSGAIGYGQEFSARHVNAWGKRTSDDIIEGVKEVCRTHPFINDKKIGCIGASYGGFMTQYLLTKTDMFAAAVSHAGISNVTSYWGEGYWGYSYNSVAAANSYPWTDPDLFTKQGSLFNADKIHTPLLLLHGTVDTNVPIGESIQLFNALKILGRDVEFITVEDQNHIIMDYNKRVLWHATIMAWFAKWLQDDPRWWDSLYGK